MFELEDQFKKLEDEGQAGVAGIRHFRRTESFSSAPRICATSARSTRWRCACRPMSAMKTARAEIKRLFDEAHELALQPQRAGGVRRHRQLAGVGDRTVWASRSSREIARGEKDTAGERAGAACVKCIFEGAGALEAPVYDRATAVAGQRHRRPGDHRGSRVDDRGRARRRRDGQ